MSSAPSPDERSNLLVLSIGKRATFHEAILGALSDLSRKLRCPLSVTHHGCGDIPHRHHSPNGHPVAYSEILRKAGRFLSSAGLPAELQVITADTASRAAQALTTTHGIDRLPHEPLVFLDADGDDIGAGPFDASVADAFSEISSALPPELRGTVKNAVVYRERIESQVFTARPYILRQLPEENWALAGDAVCLLTDHIQRCLTGTTLRTASRTGSSALARELHTFLTRRAGSRWGLHYYTGSVVSSFITDLDRLADAEGNPVLRGPSEHSLACGALARWQLDEAPFLIVVTSGMVDEFRGTLANLRDSRARGFIVCAESPSRAWYPFQGTVHGAEDSRTVLEARNIAHVYLEDPATASRDLAAAYAAYEEGRGPVVLLTTPTVLQASSLPGPADTPVPSGPPDIAQAARRSPVRVIREDALTPVVDIVNRGPDRLLWQVGHLDPDAAELVHDIARQAGVALADSLTRPGNVAQYRNGRKVPEYLGTLGLYGFSSRVYDFLHDRGRLRPPAEQCLFFLNSRIGEAATPFSPRRLRRALRIVQVAEEEEHLAPYADHVFAADVGAFLRALRERLDVAPELRTARSAAIAQAHESPSDVLHDLPVLPMSVNYFYQRVREVLERLITSEGYTYTGVYDVGRAGLSAVRNLPRTGRGFSGWYGRALMGDALQAVPSVALTRDDNVLVFVGDGASALVPDIVPTLVQQICLYGRRLRRNLTVFRLIDGGHSVIRTYHEGRGGADMSRQMQLVHMIEPEWTRHFQGVTLHHRHLTAVDGQELRRWLLHRATVNICSVPVSHNNEGDGLSLLSALGWQRDELSELSVAMTRSTDRSGEHAYSHATVPSTPSP